MQVGDNVVIEGNAGYVTHEYMNWIACADDKKQWDFGEQDDFLDSHMQYLGSGQQERWFRIQLYKGGIVSTFAPESHIMVT